MKPSLYGLILGYGLYLQTICALEPGENRDDTQNPRTYSYPLKKFKKLTSDLPISELETRDSDSATAQLIPITSTSSNSLSNLVLVADLIKGSASVSKSTATSDVDTAGSDITYYMDVQLGSDKQNFSIVVDTGSYYTWVYGVNETSSSSGNASHSYFNTSTSSSVQTLPYTFSVQYSSGAVSGSVVNDIMSFSGFETRMDFGVAEEAGSTFSSFPIDGIIGLSAKDISSDFPGIMTTLKNQSLIDQSVFGINLGSSSDTSDEGAITFGGVDASKYTGDIDYSNVVSTGGSVLWKIALAGANMGDYAVDFDGDRVAVVDTGTTLLVLPPADALTLHSYIKGAETDGSNFAVPCSTNITLQIRIGGSNWTISADDYVGSPISSGSSTCISNIQGLSSQGNTTWILGDVFLKNVYSVFDVEKQRVGFAEKVVTSTEETAADSIVYSGLSIEADTSTMTSATISETAINNLYTAVYNGTNNSTSTLQTITAASTSTSTTLETSVTSSGSSSSSSSSSQSDTTATPSKSSAVASSSTPTNSAASKSAASSLGLSESVVTAFTLVLAPLLALTLTL